METSRPVPIPIFNTVGTDSNFRTWTDPVTPVGRSVHVLRLRTLPAVLVSDVQGGRFVHVMIFNAVFLFPSILAIRKGHVIGHEF